MSATLPGFNSKFAQLRGFTVPALRDGVPGPSGMPRPAMSAVDRGSVRPSAILCCNVIYSLAGLVLGGHIPRTA